MDGGVADTARANTTVLTQAVSCCSTQRARSSRPPSTGAAIAWMEAWPAQPAITQSVNRQKVGGRRSRPPRVHESTNNRAAVSGSCSRGCADTQAPWRRSPRRASTTPVTPSAAA